jgi:septation ring formation regulator EzrA
MLKLQEQSNPKNKIKNALIHNILKEVRASSPSKRAAPLELDWFKFEYKIRAIIDNLMTPLFTTMALVKENNDQMRSTVANIETQTTQTRDLVKIQDYKTRMLDDLPRKLMQIEDKVMTFDSNYKTLEKSFQNVKHQFETFKNSVGEKVTSFERQQDP